MDRLPAKEPTGFRAGHGDVHGDEREGPEVGGGLIGRDAHGRDVQVASDGLGDLAHRLGEAGLGHEGEAGLLRAVRISTISPGKNTEPKAN